MDQDENGAIIMLRHYKIEYQSSSHTKLPFVHLTKIGPAMDMKLGRYERGNDEIIKKSIVRVKGHKPRDWEISGHSLRIGAAQDLLIQGHETIAIMRAGGWGLGDDKCCKWIFAICRA